MKPAAATLYTGISELALPHADASSSTPLTIIEDAQILVEDGRIAAVGERGSLHPHGPAECVDLAGRAVVPGGVDSHTHVVFAGHRIDEMARRARGETYEQIAQAGGGITSSVRALAAASDTELCQQALGRLRRMLAKGTTTCEIKTGYGLTPQLETKHLSAITAVAQHTPMSIVPTLLAHVIPPDARHDRAAYVTLFCNSVLTDMAATKSVKFVDIFVENGAFTADEARQIAAAARDAGLAVKLHVDQLRDAGGAALAAELKAVSADHLEYTSAAGRTALANAGVVATILPGCVLFLGKGPWPQGRQLRDAGCEVAIATDCNPGSSMVTDLFLCGSLAVTQGGLTLEEALWGITRGGAKALQLNDRGRLAVGERADFVVLEHNDWRAAFYQPGDVPIFAVAIAGAWAVRPAGH